jgi:predicted helicase
MRSFQRIYIVNLHGNVKKKEVAPDGSVDQNVFDIQQGVSILIAVKDLAKNQFVFNPDKKPPQSGIYYYDLWGSREDKYKLLHESNINTIDWEKLNPVTPFYLFVPQNDLLREEYEQFYKITDIMPINSVGIVTARDKLTIQDTPQEVEKIVNDFVSLSEEEVREKYDLGKDSQDWKVSLAQKDIIDTKANKKFIIPLLYRPFDLKYTYYTGKSSGFICRPRSEVMLNMLGRDNLGLITVRQVAEGIFNHCFVTENIIESRITISNKGIGYLFPLYIYPNTENGQNSLIKEKTANFSPQFLAVIKENLGYNPTPENIFYYIYAVLYSPNYRSRYADFLKIDFPRIPLTSNDDLFKQLAEKGSQLVNLHLLRNLPDISYTQNETLATVNLPLFNEQQRGEIHYQGDGENEIKQISYNSNLERVTINKDSYFTGIGEEVWEFKIGGYQVLDKWLKDRKKAKSKLTSEKITHYQKIIIAIKETIKIMTEIDDLIPPDFKMYL